MPETFFNTVRRIREWLSVRWQVHSNRRTAVIILCCSALCAHAYIAYISPPESFPVGSLVTVPEGVSVAEISKMLGEQGVVRSSKALQVVLKAWGKDRSIRAGDYLFKEPKSIFEVARILSIGAYGLEPRKIRIREGATVREMADIYKKQLLRFDAEIFIDLAQQNEGYLFPDTYFFLPNARESSIVKAMSDAFNAQTEQLQREVASSSRSWRDVVVMASLLEREARNSADRKLIAGVLWNRIDKEMLLQVDAAFRYTNGKGTFDLTLKDLKEDSPYNTYRYQGLPPTPIGSPSLDSLQAAAHPTANKYLFYLADHDGVTHYSKTYEEHLRLKRQYLGD